MALRRARVAGGPSNCSKWPAVAWKAALSGTSQRINAIFATGPNDAWMVGDNGTILRLRN